MLQFILVWAKNMKIVSLEVLEGEYIDVGNKTGFRRISVDPATRKKSNVVLSSGNIYPFVRKKLIVKL